MQIKYPFSPRRCQIICRQQIPAHCNSRNLFITQYLSLVKWQSLSRGAGARGPSPKAHSSLRNYGRILVSTCRSRSGQRQPEHVLRHGVLSACGRWTSWQIYLWQVPFVAMTTATRRCNAHRKSPRLAQGFARGSRKPLPLMPTMASCALRRPQPSDMKLLRCPCRMAVCFQEMLTEYCPPSNPDIGECKESARSPQQRGAPSRAAAMHIGHAGHYTLHRLQEGLCKRQEHSSTRRLQGSGSGFQEHTGVQHADCQATAASVASPALSHMLKLWTIAEVAS